MAWPEVTGLEVGAAWEYTLDSGADPVVWQAGNGVSFTVPEGTYAADIIQVRQMDGAGKHFNCR